MMHCSVIDHFIGSDRMYNNVTEANVIKSADNFCGHLPIYSKFNVNKLNLRVEEENRVSKPCWEKANLQQKEDYKINLNFKLQHIDPPEVCNNCDSLHCQLHNNAVDKYAMHMCEAVNTAAKDSLCIVGGTASRQDQKALNGAEFDQIRCHLELAFICDGATPKI